MPLPKNAEQIASTIQSELSQERRMQLIEHIRAGDKLANEENRTPEDERDKTLRQIIKNGGHDGNFVADLMKPQAGESHTE
jgi:hypothetical protein